MESKEGSLMSSPFLEMLTKHGIAEDLQIDNEKLRELEKEKKRKMYHNTQLLLKYYRDITWVLECFPANIAEELEKSMKDLDELLNLVKLELEADNYRLKSQLLNSRRSRILLNLLNEALSILKQKPGDGQLMYNALYLTYLIPEKLSHDEILLRLDISTRHYYRMRQQAINILSIYLWTAPPRELDLWLDVLTILDSTQRKKSNKKLLD